MTVITSNQAIITLLAPGVTLDKKSWNKFSGGGRTANTSQHNPGGMAPAVAVGGVTNREQATLERAWDDFLIGVYVALDAAVNGPCSIGFQALRNASTGIGNLRGYTGIIRSVTPPPADSTSSTIEMLQVVIELNEPITG